MTTAEQQGRNGTAVNKSGEGNGAGQAAPGGANSKPRSRVITSPDEEDGIPVGRQGSGVSLFEPGGRDALKGRLIEMMGGEAATPKPEARKPRAENAGEGQADEETAPEADQTHEQAEGGEGSSDQTEEEQEERPEGETEGGEETEDESEERAEQWPAAAVSKVAELRRERREARDALEQVETRLQEATQELDRREWNRPVPPTKEHPLAWLQSEEELNRWAENAGHLSGMIEEVLQANLPAVEADGNLVKWAQKEGLWNEEEGDFDRRGLRQILRESRTALGGVQGRREFLREQKQADALTMKDPILGPILSNTKSQEHDEAMGALSRVPGLRYLPHAKAAAAVYALGLREYRRLIGQNTTSGTRGARPSGKAPPGQKVIKSPGRSAVVPRNAPTALSESAALRERIKSGKASKADWEEYTKQALTGKIAGRA